MHRPTIAALAFSLALAPAAHAFTITPIFSVSSDEWTPDEMAVITQATTDWTSRLAFDNGNNQHISVNFTLIHGGTAPGSILGQWFFTGVVPAFNAYSTGLIHNVYINADYFPIESFSLDAPIPGAGKYDMLTIIRHELGHALGFYAGLYRYPNNVDRFNSLISEDSIFDPGGLNIQMNGDHNHVAIQSDLMYFSLFTDTRKEISDTDLNILSLAYGFSPIPIPEPTSLTLLTLATPLLLRRRRSRRFS